MTPSQNFTHQSAAYNVLALWKIPVWDNGSWRNTYHRFAYGRSVAVHGIGAPYDGVYAGLITAISPIRYSVESQILAGGGLVAPSVSFTLSRKTAGGTDETLDAMQSLGKARSLGIMSSVKIFLTPRGTQFDDERDLEFLGYVAAPVEITRNEIRVAVSDPLSFSTKEIPSAKFSESEQIESGRRGQPIPIIYGDFSAAGDQFTVPAICTDIFGYYSKSFRLCLPNDHGISHVGSCLKWVFGEGGGDPGYTLLTTKLVNLAKATFLAELSDDFISTSKHRYHETDRFYIDYCAGNVNASGKLLQGPLDVLKDLLFGTSYLNLPHEYFDMDSFDMDYFVSEDAAKVKRVLTKPADIRKLLSDLLTNFGLIMAYSKGKFFLHRVCWHESAQPESPDVMIIRPLTYETDFSVSIGRQGWNVHSISVRCNESPLDGRLREETTRSDETDSGVPESHSLDAPWVGNNRWASQLAADILATRTVHPVLVNAALPLLGLDDRLGILGWIKCEESMNDSGQILRPLGMADRAFQIIEYERDPVKGEGRITALNLGNPFGSNIWTTDNAPDFEQAAEAQKEVLGFWTDDDGFCRSGDPTSNKSHWL